MFNISESSQHKPLFPHPISALQLRWFSCFVSVHLWYPWAMEPNTSLLRKAYTLLLLNLIPCPVTDPNSTGPNAEFGRNEAPLSVFLFHEKQTQTMQSAWKHNRSQPVGRVTHLRSWKEQDDKSRSYFFFCTYFIILAHCDAGQGRSSTPMLPPNPWACFQHGTAITLHAWSGLCLHGVIWSCKKCWCP